MSTTESLTPTLFTSDDMARVCAQVDADAASVVLRLVAADHQAYLVGGCVRDLLLGRDPKDFDVATSAHPSEIRMIFRNSRLIGRRFRLAHVHFKGGKIVETATFRASPFEDAETLPEDLLIDSDNVFGSAEQDARRRDFTINGLFLDLEHQQVIDFVEGVGDLRQRVIRTIGDPDIRLQEDPVRILRAVKFAARLDFSIEEATAAAMRRHAGALVRCAPARLTEELYRLVHSGAARRAVSLLAEVGASPVLLGDGLAQLQGTTAEPGTLALLGAYDAARARGFLGSNALALALLLLAPYEAAGEDKNAWLERTLDDLGERLRLPRNDRERARLMLHLLPDLTRQPRTERLARQVVRRSAFAESLALYTMLLHGSGNALTPIGEWKAVARSLGVAIEALPGAPRRGERRGRRPRRPGRRSPGQQPSGAS